MFDRSGIPLWVHVMLGVASGCVIAGVVLYSLFLWHMRVQLDDAARAVSRTVLQSPGVSTRPHVPVPVARGVGASAQSVQTCPVGHTPGLLNGVPVCVSSGGRVVER